MRVVVFLSLLGVLFGQSVRAQQTKEVSGSLLGHNGAPMVMAHVHVHPSRVLDEVIESVAVDSDGRYTLSLDTTGVFTLRFTGVNHNSKRVPLFFDEKEQDDPVTIDVRLEGYNYREEFEVINVIGDFNDFSFSDGRPMSLAEDDTYIIDIETDADTLAYQVLNVLEDRGGSVNGTMADRYVYDGAGDYRSIIPVEDGVARIVFDPEQLVESQNASEAAFTNPISAAAGYAALYDELDARWTSYIDGQIQLREADATNEDYKAYADSFDWSPSLIALEEYLPNTETAMERHTAWLLYIEKVGRPESSYCERALAEIEPTSMLWTLGGGHILDQAIGNTGDPSVYDDLVYEVMEHHPSEFLKPKLIMRLLWQASKNEKPELQRILVTWLATEYPDSFEYSRAQKMYVPDRPIQEGKPGPEFSVTAFSDSTTTYSNESLLGTTYLIDFWATWCAPCVAEMPELHEAYETYRDKDFSILSLSFDGSADDVINFRSEEWEMPWMHTYMAEGFQSEIADAFDAIWLPTYVLIGPDGTILATDSDLRGEKLLETLASVFEADSKNVESNAD